MGLDTIFTWSVVVFLWLFCMLLFVCLLLILTKAIYELYIIGRRSRSRSTTRDTLFQESGSSSNSERFYSTEEHEHKQQLPLSRTTLRESNNSIQREKVAARVNEA